jgi:hypothetical protein
MKAHRLSSVVFFILQRGAMKILPFVLSVLFHFAGLGSARRTGEIFSGLHPHRKKLSQEVMMEWGESAVNRR